MNTMRYVLLALIVMSLLTIITTQLAKRKKRSGKDGERYAILGTIEVWWNKMWIRVAVGFGLIAIILWILPPTSEWWTTQWGDHWLALVFLFAVAILVAYSMRPAPKTPFHFKVGGVLGLLTLISILYFLVPDSKWNKMKDWWKHLTFSSAFAESRPTQDDGIVYTAPPLNTGWAEIDTLRGTRVWPARPVWFCYKKQDGSWSEPVAYDPGGKVNTPESPKLVFQSRDSEPVTIIVKKW